MKMSDAILTIIPTGIIPESQCPRCTAPLMVVNKRNFSYFGQAPQFVGCSAYPQCGYVRVVKPEDVTIMQQVQAERDAMPAEF